MTLRHRLDGRDGAPVLVLSNPIGTTHDVWDAQVPTFAAHFRVLRYDYPPAGTVERLARGLLELLGELQIDRSSFCGLSLGGTVGMWLGAEAPQRIDRLVLACTSACFDASELYLERAELVQARGMEAVADASLGRWFTPRFAATGRYRQMLLSIQPDAYAAMCEAVAAWDFTERLGAISAPTLVVAGAEDQSTPPVHAELIAERIPHAEVTVLEGAGHLANVEQPEAFNETVLAHLAGVRA
jgi:3-oxoadipate enol-lactonase